MSETTITRLARAAYEVHARQFTDPGMALAFDPSWEALGEEGQKEYRDVVRAVLAELREPTEEMLADCQNLPGSDGGRILNTQATLRIIWQAQIDSILKEDAG